MVKKRILLFAAFISKFEEIIWIYCKMSVYEVPHSFYSKSCKTCIYQEIMHEKLHIVFYKPVYATRIMKLNPK